jgi:hypothetical protein
MVFFSSFQDVLHTICQASGQVLRIVIFKKNGVQAMVEYPWIFISLAINKWLNEKLNRKFSVSRSRTLL